MTAQPEFDTAFWAQVMADAIRTIFCSPADEDRIRAAVDRHGIAGLITVTPSPAVKPGQLYLSNDNAVERVLQWELGRPIRYRPTSTVSDNPKGTP